MHKVDFLKHRLVNNQPTSSHAWVIVPNRTASALSRSCPTFAYSSPSLVPPWPGEEMAHPKMPITR
jgi:hypothetical protein